MRNFYSGASRGNGNGSGGTITLAPTIVVWPPRSQILADDGFVRNLYFYLLHRDGEAANVSHWTAQLLRGVSREAVVQIFENSLEYRTRWLRDLYRSLLRRDPDTKGLQDWLDYLAQGHRFEEVQAGFLASPEYFSPYFADDIDGFLTRVYRDVFNRPVDSSGQDTWSRLLANGATRREVALGVLTSQEAAGNVVTALYYEYLHRAPDAQGFADWVGLLQQGGSQTDVLTGVLASEEYFVYYGPVE